MVSTTARRIARNDSATRSVKALTNYTPARVSLGLAGDSLPTKPLLAFRLAHARAREAVHFPLDSFSLAQEFAARGWGSRILRSTAKNREQYLRNPDKGRTLNGDSLAELSNLHRPRRYAFVVADGLSSLAVHRHSASFLEEVFERLDFKTDEANPVFIVHQGRVAIGDHIGAAVGAELAIVIIGERPGLSAPDSLGVYLTWNPKPGRTDAERNCISNIQSSGLSYEAAANKLVFLMNEAQRRQLTGVALKETAAKLLE
ncbi:MAG: ethanolamine ammonia-lyase subunit EutC [Acidobacteriaceae bacterium]|nr:ethanolamine ammonia-lyase subunit EutC [Acidobacteriaceae bacterium]MBV9782095.1 ethanolamine ammonia-lyase subunit EutC [Acidobacteriaceae bacterium]